MKLISINNGHGASVAYMEDGIIKFALQEERLTRIKNQPGFPRLALLKALEVQEVSIDDIDAFIFTDQATIGIGRADQDARYWKGKFNSMFEPKPHSLALNLRQSIRCLLSYIPPIDKHLKKRSMERMQAERAEPLNLLGVPHERIVFMDHHTCHASSAAYGWGMNGKFAVLTSDGIGDGVCGTISLFQDGRLERKAEIRPEGSVALIYAMTTSYLGMQPIEHEYKLMGMAPYAEQAPQARSIADALRKLFVFNEDGLTYRPKDQNHPQNLAGFLKTLFAYQRFDHIAAGMQIFTEEFVAEWTDRLMKKLAVRKIALSGGLFMNVKLNKKIMELDQVDDVYVFPSCGDDTNVFGALYRYYFQKTGKVPQALTHLYLGGEHTNEEIKAAINSFPFKTPIESKYYDDVEQKVAELLADNHIVARFSGGMEFGARALGNRSIIANPSHPETIQIINKMIKSRDFWMPFAPSCIDLDTYFENQKRISSPYMMFTFNTKKEKVKFAAAAIHPYDQTARPQEVREDDNKNYHSLLRKFEKLTGENIVLNTSFNLHGYPVVYSPKDALEVLDSSGLQYLALGNFVIHKTNAQ